MKQRLNKWIRGGVAVTLMAWGACAWMPPQMAYAVILACLGVGPTLLAIGLMRAWNEG